MPIYRIVAYNKNDVSKKRFEMIRRAPNERELIASVDEEGSAVYGFAPEREFLFSKEQNRYAEKKAQLYEKIAYALKGGIPRSSYGRTLVGLFPGNDPFAPIYEAFLKAVETKPFWKAMQLQPTVFSPQEIEILMNSNGASDDTAFELLAKELRTNVRMQKSIGSKIVGPLILFGIVLLAILYVIFYTIPKGIIPLVGAKNLSGIPAFLYHVNLLYTSSPWPTLFTVAILVATGATLQFLYAIKEIRIELIKLFFMNTGPLGKFFHISQVETLYRTIIMLFHQNQQRNIYAILANGAAPPAFRDLFRQAEKLYEKSTTWSGPLKKLIPFLPAHHVAMIVYAEQTEGAVGVIKELERLTPELQQESVYALDKAVPFVYQIITGTVVGLLIWLSLFVVIPLEASIGHVH